MTHKIETLISAANFRTKVRSNGYRWWYVDAFTDDYQYGLTIIAFIGSVFSPYYAWSRQRGSGNPYNHCAINISLYGKGGKRWSMTERSDQAVKQSSSAFSVGPSSLELQNGQLLINVDEWTFPIPGRLRGHVRVKPLTLIDKSIPLDLHSNHKWQPIAPLCEVFVDFDSPKRQWQGHGYFDTNWGTEPLEIRFKNWDWSRAMLPDGRSAILYDVLNRNGTRLSLALTVDREGKVSHFQPSDRQGLKRSIWQINRQTQSDKTHQPIVTSTLEDAPFYSRSILNTSILGEQVTAMHESLDLERFSSSWVKFLLPFKMPKR